MRQDKTDNWGDNISNVVHWSFKSLMRLRYGRACRYFMLFVSLWFAVLPTAQVLAAAGGTPVNVLVTRTAPGETTSVIDGPNGFQIVLFLLGGVEVSRVESGTPNTGGGGGGANNVNANYAADAVDENIDKSIPGAIDGNVAKDLSIPNPFAALGPPLDFTVLGPPLPRNRGRARSPRVNPPRITIIDGVKKEKTECEECFELVNKLKAEFDRLQEEVRRQEDIVNDGIAVKENIIKEEPIKNDAAQAALDQLRKDKEPLIAKINAINDVLASADTDPSALDESIEELKITVEIAGLFAASTIVTAVSAASLAATLPVGATGGALILTAAIAGGFATGAVVLIVASALFVAFNFFAPETEESNEEKIEKIKNAQQTLQAQLEAIIAAERVQKEILEKQAEAERERAEAERERAEAEKERVKAEIERLRNEPRNIKAQQKLDQLVEQLNEALRLFLEQSVKCLKKCPPKTNRSSNETLNPNQQRVAAVAAKPALTARTNFNAKSNAAPYQPISVKGNKLTGKFDLRTYRNSLVAAGQRNDGGTLIDLPDIFGDQRFNIWVTPSVSFNENTNSGPSQNGTSVSISGGVSWLLTPTVNVGLVARYANTRLKGLGSKTNSDTWSTGGFVQALVAGKINLNITGVYSHSSVNDTTNAGGAITTSKANADAFSGQASLSRSFKLGEFTVTPALNASYVHINRKAFFLSDGTLIGRQKSNQLTFSGGPTISRIFEMGDSGVKVTPSLGVNVFVNASRAKSFLDVNGIRRKAGNYGVSISTGVGFKAPNGISWALNGGFSGSQGGQRSFTLGGNLNVPLN